MSSKKRVVFIAIILGAAGMAGGCAPQSAVRQAAVPAGFAVPDQWPGNTLDPLSPQPATDPWWASFGDGELDRIVEEALAGSFNLRAAASRIDRARFEARIAGVGDLPTLEASLNRSQQRQNFIGFPIPGAQEGAVLSTTSTNYGLRFNASWEPDLWGRIEAGELGALTSVRSGYADLAAAQLSLTGQVAKAWFAAVEAERQWELAGVALESLELSASRIQVRFEAGLRPSLDLRLALTEVARARATLEQRTEQRERAVRQLEALLGRYPSGEYPLSARLPELSGSVPAGLPSELVHRRPDLVAAELNVVSAGARLTQSEADLRPRFNLTGGTGTASGDLLGLVDNDLFVWSFVGNLVQPLFNGGRLDAAVDRDRSAVDEAIHVYEAEVLGAYGEVESALAADAVLARQEAALEEAVVQSVAAEELAGERYRLGLADIITVLSSQRTADASESQLVAIRRARLDNRVDLHMALGGGFDPADVPTALDLMQDSPEPGSGNNGNVE
jgi:NodT family efflux transporter outer membrane factor (OMF) lipoprotein